MNAGTLGEALEQAAASTAGVDFVRRSGESQRFLYQELRDRAARVAGALRREGIAPTDRVALTLPTSVEFYDAFFGAVLAGAVPVSLPAPRRFAPRDEYERSLAAQLRSCGAKLLLTGPGPMPELRGPTRVMALSALELGDALEPVPATPESLALVQFSSGTTREPRPVALSHEQVLWNTRSILRVLLDAYPERGAFVHRALSWLPLYHDMGLVGSVLTALTRPGPLVLMSPELFVARPALWLRAISEHRATVSAAPHFAYAMCIERIEERELEGVDLSSWKLALDGAEMVTPDTLERFYERFRACGLAREALTPVYGLAEASLAVTFPDPRQPFHAIERGGRRLVSVGPPLDGIELDVTRDEEDGADGVGKIRVRGPSVMQGYLSPDGSVGGLDGGWLDTGDHGLLHEGELFLTGRRADRLVVRGRSYAAEAIEQGLEGVAGLRPGALMAISVATDSGEELAILAEAVSPEGIRERVVERLTERLGLSPGRVMVVKPGSLPRTSSGKLRRGVAAKRFATELQKLEPASETSRGR